ncbi:squalene/phytoene synthase family protein [Ureibacillus thermophilus]|uniref:Phytoene/squalene synthase family protein n=1 Tax=Ureibacillus thermophilus TaxID=367743 RepID=A0A4P6US74_9BACL|nr:phytoene/squalene synthase family protein [Ureibacillus thermophilus]QBK25894.1 phytoene/squalene synthase family protein [Ureibacillus thermophilus]
MNKKALEKDAMRVLKETSRTFYIPITFLKKDLKTAVANAYLIMRALDEIEDNEHPEVTNKIKYSLLMETSELLKEETFNNEKYLQLLEPVKPYMPEVTIRMNDWISLLPAGSEKIVCDAASEMAFGMAKWAKANWDIRTKEDLDDYTYYVAGLVGVMLSDLWEWDSQVKTDRELAIGYGRGLQAVNILRNQHEDFETRGVSFIPEGWSREDLFHYTEENLQKADCYMENITKRSILLFCRLPLTLAHKTLNALKEGKEKVSRSEVEETVKEILAD